MFNTPILDIVLGLVFIFLLYSLLATSVKEAIAGALGLRARMLRRGIVEAMFSDTPDHPRLVSMAKGVWDYIREFVFLFTGRMGDKKGLGYHFYRHPIMKNYGSNKVFSHPSYISAQNFSLVLIETLKWDFTRKLDKIVTATYDPGSGATQDEYRAQLLNSPDAMQIRVLLLFYLAYYKELGAQNAGKVKSRTDKVKDYLLGEKKMENEAETMKNMRKVQASAGILELMEEPVIDRETMEILQLHLSKSIFNIEAFSGRMERWFNDTMDRVTGWYKRQVQVILMIIGFVMGFMFNVDVIDITTKLSKDDKLRDKLVQSAVAYSKAHEELPADTGARQRAGAGGADAKPANNADSDAAAYRREVKEKFGKVDSMVDHDVHDVNTLLALGYGDYGRTNAGFIGKLKDKHWIGLRPYWIPIYVSGTAERYMQTSEEAERLSNYVRDSLKGAVRSADIRPGTDTILLDEVMSLYKPGKPPVTPEMIGAVKDQRFYDKEVALNGIHVKTAYMWYVLRTNRHKWLGFFLLGLAVCLGAPFWFDLLNKIVNLRAAGKKVGTSAGDDGKGSKDQDKAPQPVVIQVNNQAGEEEAVG